MTGELPLGEDARYAGEGYTGDEAGHGHGRRRADLRIAEVTVDLGVAQEPVHRSMKQADRDSGTKKGPTTSEQAEVVKLCPRMRRLERSPTGLRIGHPISDFGPTVIKDVAGVSRWLPNLSPVVTRRDGAEAVIGQEPSGFVEVLLSDLMKAQRA